MFWVALRVHAFSNNYLFGTNLVLFLCIYSFIRLGVYSVKITVNFTINENYN